MKIKILINQIIKNIIFVISDNPTFISFIFKKHFFDSINIVIKKINIGEKISIIIISVI